MIHHEPFIPARRTPVASDDSLNLEYLNHKFWFRSWRFCFQFSLKMVSRLKDAVTENGIWPRHQNVSMY